MPTDRRRRGPRRLALAAALLFAFTACGSDPPSALEAERSGAAQVLPDADRARLRVPGPPATLSELDSLDELEVLFDRNAEAPQLVLLLSATCGECLIGASWVQQEILRKHPDAPLNVYAIWEPILATDNRSEWDDHLLNDPRVTHLWSEDKIVGRFYAAEYEDRPKWTQWDAYYLYDRGARWDDARSKLQGSGRTILARSDHLRRELAPLLSPVR